MNKVHYKMFKAGKKWMIAGITTVAISTGAFMVNSIDANADVVSNASAYLGTPYQYGGNSFSGIDCSALVKNAYAADGIILPRTSGDQYRVTTQESAADAQYGDLVFFGRYGSDHVGIYSGNGNMINAETVDGVRLRRISVMEKYLGTASYGRVNGATQAAAYKAAADKAAADKAADQAAADKAAADKAADQAAADQAADQAAADKAAADKAAADQAAADKAAADQAAADKAAADQAAADQAAADKAAADQAAADKAAADQAAADKAAADQAAADKAAADKAADQAAADQAAADKAAADQAADQAAADKAAADQAADQAAADKAAADQAAADKAAADQAAADQAAADKAADQAAADQAAVPEAQAPAQLADVNNNQNNNITSVEPEKTDVKPVDNQVVKVVTPTNQKDTLPATGETKNSLLTVIGLGLISFVTLLGFKIRKNN
ncbi:NlpC/P60 family protein [Fructilactobacillus sanfranciscensis]|uniref:NlpC/P60 family protein n=1 Tax=Fructilactobacillus sanfranciscensis TaxID=1625 RepID=UPI0013D68191|nr:NlpC/P60 family protein [Fructilactobacillus sanfranciscensis]NDR76669.1 LPXTG cell wall anchor domain-containing protein [Fructilactobacillus sanfranciscensis]